MQLFTCPFCGPRDETEFHYGGEAGTIRPGGLDVTAVEWARYLYIRANPKGHTREIWVHTTCGEFLVMERDTVSHAVSKTQSLGEEHIQ